MWRWVDVKMRRCEDEKVRYRPPLLEEPCAQTLSGISTDYLESEWSEWCLCRLPEIEPPTPFLVLDEAALQETSIAEAEIWTAAARLAGQGTCCHTAAFGSAGCLDQDPASVRIQPQRIPVRSQCDHVQSPQRPGHNKALRHHCGLHWHATCQFCTWKKKNYPILGPYLYKMYGYISLFHA